MARVKNAVAVADGYNVTCPYKPCGIQMPFDSIKNGMIVPCTNCGKMVRIKAPKIFKADKQ